MRRSGLLLTFVGTCLLPAYASAQSGAAGNELPPLAVGTEGDGNTASIELRHVDNEHGNVLIWGPGLQPTSCTLPCGVYGGGGQFGATVITGEAGFSVGFVLPSLRTPSRVTLRPPNVGRSVGAGILLGFGTPSSAAGLGMAITAMATASSSSGIAVVFGLMIALPLLAAGVPMTVGGVYLARTAGPSAVVEVMPRSEPMARSTMQLPLLRLSF